MKQVTIPLILVAFLLLASAVLAQSGNGYGLSWWTVDGGGQTFSSGGGYELGGTIGQPDAGVMAGGDYTLGGGFWGGGAGMCGDVAPYPGCDGAIEIGDVALLLNYVGYGDPYQLCCDWCGDVAPYPDCDGAIEMGDVVLLLNYVGHPGEYNLCCEVMSSRTVASAVSGVLAATQNEVKLIPQDSSAPFCETAEVDIWADATNFQGGQIRLAYDSTCADIEGWIPNSADFPLGTWDSDTPGEEWITFSALSPMTGTYRIGTLTIHCVSEEGCGTDLDFVEGGLMASELVDDWGNEIPATWKDGTFRGGMYNIYLPLILRNYSPIAFPTPTITPTATPTLTPTLTPTPTPTSTPRWTPLGPEGVEVRSLAVSPNWSTDRTIVFGSWYQPGKFYRTTDGGRMWWSTQPLGDVSYNHFFDAIALSPDYQHGGLDQTVFLGGGNGAGVYLSADSGETWSRNTAPGTTWDFAVSPGFATDQTVFVSGNYGVYKSVDGGVTFTPVNNGLPGNGGGSYLALAISPAYPTDQTIFVGHFTHGVYKSTDGGDSWVPASEGLPTGPDVEMEDLAISPNYASDQTIFAALWTRGIYRSTDGGSTWSLAYPDAYVIPLQSLAISPNYAVDRTLFAGTTFHYGTWTGVVVSQDGGDTWSQMDNTGFSSLALESAPRVVVSPDFAVDHRIFVGTRDGVWTTTLEPTPTPPATFGPGKRIQIPRIDGDEGWDTRIHVQNIGDAQTGVITLFWEEYSGQCPGPGPVDYLCHLIPGRWGILTVEAEIPAEAKSAIVYSVSDDLFEAACEAAGNIDSQEAWIEWENTYAYSGELLGVTVNRLAYNDASGSGMYNGFSETMLDSGPPFDYYAPLQAIDQEETTTQLAIQNAGNACASGWVYWLGTDCEIVDKQSFEHLAPGESMRVQRSDSSLTTAHIQSSQPLAIVVDRWDADSTMLLTYAGIPADYGANTNYAPLIYRAIGGWDTEIEVQNLSSSESSVVIVTFIDANGDKIFCETGWICPGGSAIFRHFDEFSAVPGIGTAVIESHEQVEYPGAPPSGPPIASIVSLINSDSGEAFSYNAPPSQQVKGVTGFAFPVLRKQFQGRTSQIAVANPSGCFVNDLRIDFYDETGQVVFSALPPGQYPMHLDYIDLLNYGNLPAGWVGGVVVTLVGSENLCGPDEEDEPAMAAVALDRHPGDSVGGQELFPLPTPTPTPTPTSSPTATPTSTSTPTSTATPTPTPTLPICEELIHNGGFETTGDWTIGNTLRPAQYSSVAFRSGSWSMRLGITYQSDAQSDSSIYQEVTIPGDAESATLSFWYYPLSQDSLPHDWQEAIIYDHTWEILDRAMPQVCSNSQTWTHHAFNLIPYKGQTIILYFNVYNDGEGDLKTAMYLDDVSIRVCR